MNKKTYLHFCQRIEYDYQAAITEYVKFTLDKEGSTTPVSKLTMDMLPNIFGRLDELPANAVAVHELIDGFFDYSHCRFLNHSKEEFPDDYLEWAGYFLKRREKLTKDEQRVLSLFDAIFVETENFFHVDESQLIKNIQYWYMYTRTAENASYNLAMEILRKVSEKKLISPRDRREFLLHFSALNQKGREQVVYVSALNSILDIVFPKLDEPQRQDQSWDVADKYTVTLHTEMTDLFRTYLREEEL